MDITKCLHGNGPECERCKAMDIPEVEEMEAEITALRAALASAEERAAKAENGEQVWKYAAEMRCRDLDAAIAQRDELAATVAGLRGALVEHVEFLTGFLKHLGNASITGACQELLDLSATALAASPAEHAARIQAAALRSMGDYLSHVSREVKEEDHHEYDLWSGLAAAAQHCYSEADRLDKAVVA